MDEELKSMLATIVKEIHNFKNDMHKGFQDVDERFEKVDQRFEKMDQRFEKIDQHFEKMDQRLEKVESQVSALRSGQIETRKEIKEVSIKVSETYDLALDSWGQSSENRKWLEKI